MTKILKSLILMSLMVAYSASAQVEKDILNWYNGAAYGMSTDKAYAKLLAGKTGQPVVVAVIDSGVDINHEDLQGSIWVNTDEIPNNGIDDDNNGYIDDVNGWSFLGNPNGENVNHEQLEVTRLYVMYDPNFKGLSEADVSDVSKADFARYVQYRDEVESARSAAAKNLERYAQIEQKYLDADAKLKAHFGGDYSAKDVKSVIKNADLADAAALLYPLKKAGGSIDDVKKGLKRGIDHFQGQLDYHYNLTLDARAIIGDDPSDFTERIYGNNDVQGPDAFHGTHVAGIIAATRGNGIGNDGVASNVLIMSVRAVPDGDERDKDVAMAIRYAADNGAQIINGSFGKSYSPYQDEVIKAIRYAESKGVLICHAAGNSSKDIGKETNFPSPKYPSMSAEFANWIEVGASTRYKKAKINKKTGSLDQQGLAATFSNYNSEMVDVFAPGLEIYATTPGNTYAAIQGTSMASPMVAGVAALLKSYYPSLTMLQIRDIIFESVQKIDLDTPLPGDVKPVPFKDLSSTGGIVNVYNAVVLAEERSQAK